MPYHIILHTTTACNYDCSYCDVIKDGKILSETIKKQIQSFVDRNQNMIQTFKFFGGEPLIASKDILFFCDKLPLSGRYHIVTNTTLLSDPIGVVFRENFQRIFFSIDTEHIFDYERVSAFVDRYDLWDKVFCNVVITPGKEDASYNQFCELFARGFRGYNILPVYFTQPWGHENLKALSMCMKKILDHARSDPTLKLMGFQENEGYDHSLINHSLFIDTDGNVYYSDMVSTYAAASLKESLKLGHIRTLSLSDISSKDLQDRRQLISNLEKSLYSTVSGQRELHRLMDYFSLYMNHYDT